MIEHIPSPDQNDMRTNSNSDVYSRQYLLQRTFSRQMLQNGIFCQSHDRITW